MAAHLGASCSRPTIIVANGVNYARFTEYERSGISRVATVYPGIFNRKRRHLGEFSCNYEDVVTADIESIEARTVFEKLREVMARLNPDRVTINIFAAAITGDCQRRCRRPQQEQKPPRRARVRTRAHAAP